MIADLHCHYPMHLLPENRDPDAQAEGWFARLRDEFQAEALELLARAINNPGWGPRWRVDLDGLHGGGARVICSVLYWPYAEFDLDRGYGAPPEAGYFDDLRHQLEVVERDLERLDPRFERHKLVRSAADLADDGRVAVAHCVEGGFHLGADPEAIDANVAWLSAQGVVYVTLAHLFFRGIAANTPAIPLLSDEMYDRLFPQAPGVGLTELGRAALRAMYRHRILVDISHMRQDALDDTFELLAELDEESGADARDYPVIATHVGVREAGPDSQAYNLDAETVLRIHGRGGLVGLIMAEHQLGDSDNEAEAAALVARHIDALHAIVGTHELTAIGTDLDGFIKPTVHGLERAADLPKLERWIRASHPDAAESILHGNAVRVLSAILGPAPRG